MKYRKVVEILLPARVNQYAEKWKIEAPLTSRIWIYIRSLWDWRIQDAIYEFIDCYKGFDNVNCPCKDCGIETNKYESYMVYDHVWFEANRGLLKQGHLCVGCLEIRLGRKLVQEDFTQCRMNVHPHKKISERLTSRLGSVIQSDYDEELFTIGWRKFHPRSR